MALRLVSVLNLALGLHLSFAFNLYPAIDPVKLGKAFNISTECVTALNQSIPECDQTLLQMVSQFENYWWEEDNVTALCVGNCSQAASDWTDSLGDACYGQYFSAYGKFIPAYSVAQRFVDGLNVACLPSWSEGHSWCLTESQEWVGSDIIRVDCTQNPGDPTCGRNASAIPSQNVRIANLYDDSTLCNDCFVWMLYSRITSNYLADADYSDYLVDQLQDIQDICSTQLPDYTVRAVPTYDPAPVPSSVPLDSTTTTTTAAPPTSSTCAGQTVSSGTGCNSISTTYGVTTGDLQTFTNSDTCQILSPVCLPQRCTLQQVTAGQTCDSLAAGLNITTIQFLSWNPNIQGLCDSLLGGQYVCFSAPGTNSTYTLPPPPLGTGADAGNQQRGGSGGVVTPTSTATTTGNSASEGSGPSPTQDGLTSSCNNFAVARSGDNCVDFSKAHNIQPSQLYAWNPVLGLNGANCSTNFWANEYYCIGVWATATAPATAPGPTQSGITASCNKYAQAVGGDSCDAFAARNSISNAQLYAWNAVLGTKGENCATSLWAQEWYCVGISAAPPPVTTSTTTSKVTAPGPTQTGIADNCNKYAEAIPGDSCTAFASRNGITSAQLYTWNTVLGADGANCATSLWANEYYCVGVGS